MKQSNNQVGEKVLVLGAGQLGASVLASLVPAVTQRNGSVCVIVSGRSRDKQSKRRSSDSVEDIILQGYDCVIRAGRIDDSTTLVA
ncbi:hypothetical protein L0D14_24185, partial [Salmonella enterica subsp. enterica]|nr:hypothetical protein [Salmonella enterica subsp. enterica]